MTKLFLHVSLPKTATTSIQNFLSLNRDKLKRDGWLYPLTARQYMAHHLLGNFFRADNLDWIGQADPAATRAALLDEVRASGCDNVIMSSESLVSSTRIAEVKQFFSDFDVQIVYVLRRQDHWIESAYQEHLKRGPAIQTPEQFEATRGEWLDHFERLEAWAQVFGRENIRVGVFERGGARQSVEAAFLDLIGARMRGDYAVPPEMNTRLNRDSLGFLTGMQTKRRIHPRFTLYAKFLGEYSSRHPDPPEWRKVWPPAARRKMVEDHAASNAQVARAYLGSDSGVLFREPLPALDEPWSPYPGLTPEKAVEIGEFLADRLYDRSVQPPRAGKAPAPNKKPRKNEVRP